MTLVTQDFQRLCAQAAYLRSLGYRVVIVGDDEGLAVKVLKRAYIRLLNVA